MDAQAENAAAEVAAASNAARGAAEARKREGANMTAEREGAKMSSAQTAEPLAKPRPCPCQEPGAVTLEQIDQRVAALARLVIIAIVAAGVAYVLAGRKSEEE